MLTFWTNSGYPDLAPIAKPVLASLDYKLENDITPIQEGTLPHISQGDVVLAMGTPALEVLKSLGAVPKNLSIKSLRGKMLNLGHGRGLLSFDPAAQYVDAFKPEEIAWDIRLAERVHRTGALDPDLGSYRYVPNLDTVLQYIDLRYARTGKPVDVAMDLETMGLYPWYPDKQIVSMSVTVAEGVADVLYFPDLGQPKYPNKLWDNINALLNSPRVRMKGANLKFDLQWIKEKWGITCSNFSMDTLLCGSLLNENRSNSLNQHAKTYTSMGGYDDVFNSSHDKGHMELIPKNELLPYAGGDSDATLRTSNALRAQLEQPENLGLQRFYIKLLHPAVRAFEKVERNGLVIDRPKMKELQKELQGHIKEREQYLVGVLPARIRNKYKLNIEKALASGKSPFTPAILQDLFFSKTGFNLKPVQLTAKTQKPSTTHEHLMMFSDHAAAAQVSGVLEDINRARKTLSTYVDGFLAHLRPDGKLHPTYMLFNGSAFESAKRDDNAGTVTGRTSARDPAIQTLPKHTFWAKRLRECYPAPPGKTFFQCDFSQGELRIAACVADEPTMLRAYREDVDLHALTGAKLTGMPLEAFMAQDTDAFKLGRQRAKAGNFGLIYGMAAEGYVHYAKSSYQVDLTKSQAVHDVEEFFSLYPRLRRWHSTYINLAHKFGQVASPLGRVRHLPLVHSNNSMVRSTAERQAINSPIQSTLSDLCLWAIAELDRIYGIDDELEVIGMTHDSIYGYVPEDNCEEWAQRVAEVMGNLPIKETFGWETQIPFPADIELGPTFAGLVERPDLRVA